MGDAQIFHIFRSHLRILDSRLVTWSKFHNEYSQIRVLGATVKLLSPWQSGSQDLFIPALNAWFYTFCITGWFPAEPPTQTYYYGLNMVPQTFINMCKFGSMNGHLVDLMERDHSWHTGKGVRITIKGKMTLCQDMTPCRLVRKCTNVLEEPATYCMSVSSTFNRLVAGISKTL